MQLKVVIADFNRWKTLPEDCLYLASKFHDEIHTDDIRIVKVTNPEDSGLLQSVIEAGDNSQIILVLNLSDFFPTLVLVKLFLYHARRYADTDNIITVASGGHPSLAANQFFDSGLFDFVIAGWPWLVDISILFGRKRGVISLNLLPDIPSNIDMVPMLRKIVNPNACQGSDENGSFFSYAFSKMCTNACSFCFADVFRRKYGGYYAKDKSRIEAELSALKDFFHSSQLMFANVKVIPSEVEFLLTSGFRISELMDLCIKDITFDFLNLLKKAGMRAAFVGFESIDGKTREKIGKPFRLDQFSSILEYGNKLGLMFEGNLMLGIKAASGHSVTRKDLEEEVIVAANFYRRFPNLRLTLEPFMPFVGTALGDRTWGHLLQSGSFSLDIYLMLIALITKAKPLPQSFPLPPCYADKAAYDFICEIQPDFNALVQLKSCNYWYSPKNKSKQKLCNNLIDHCNDSLEKASFGFADFVNGTLNSIAHWR